MGEWQRLNRVLLEMEMKWNLQLRISELKMWCSGVAALVLHLHDG